MATNIAVAIQKPYVATTVTLAAASPTRYRLWDLVNANRPNTPMSAREVNVQISSSGGAHVYFGDGAVTELDYGFVLSAADGLARRWASNQGNNVWGFVFVITDTPGATISVEVEGC
jgi:hypothetical protein